MTAKADLSRTDRLVLSVARLWLTLRHPALIVRFFMKLGYLPNPAAPVRYHELLLWRKILDRNPLFVTLTDKLAAKAHIRGACPGIPIPKTLWCGRDATDIPPGLLTGAVVVIRRSPAKSSGSGGSTDPPSCADLTTGLCASMPTRFAPDAGATLQMTRPTPRGAPDEAAGIGSAFFCNYPMNLSFEQLTKPAWTPARRSPIKPKEMQK